MLEQKSKIAARVVNEGILHGPQFLMVRPSRNNLHEFVAEENTCFFDICLPNYTTDKLRRITYFKEHNPADHGNIYHSLLVDSTKNLSTHSIDNLTYISYDTTPPKLPINFEIADIAYRGEYKIWERFIWKKSFKYLRGNGSLIFFIKESLRAFSYRRYILHSWL